MERNMTRKLRGFALYSQIRAFERRERREARELRHVRQFSQELFGCSLEEATDEQWGLFTAWVADTRKALN